MVEPLPRIGEAFGSVPRTAEKGPHGHEGPSELSHLEQGMQPGSLFPSQACLHGAGVCPGLAGCMEQGWAQGWPLAFRSKQALCSGNAATFSMSRSEMPCFLVLCITALWWRLRCDRAREQHTSPQPCAHTHTHHSWIFIANTKCVCDCGMHMHTVCAHEHICQRPAVDAQCPALCMALHLTPLRQGFLLSL